jgi:MtN3 and saliva related transmembrane protein
MDSITALGLAAGFCTTFAYLPQVIKSLKTRRTEDISLLMVLVFLTGLLLWEIYGIITNQFPVIAANGATIILLLLVLVAKLKYG